MKNLVFHSLRRWGWFLQSILAISLGRMYVSNLGVKGGSHALARAVTQLHLGLIKLSILVTPNCYGWYSQRLWRIYVWQLSSLSLPIPSKYLHVVAAGPVTLRGDPPRRATASSLLKSSLDIKRLSDFRFRFSSLSRTHPKFARRLLCVKQCPCDCFCIRAGRTLLTQLSEYD